mmetsp:Transcript_81793/g.226604  ORF Transcript_81793/g.226604 Transcript_81793/m.226604 type:complete len:598 (-) Transcript_81793:243-2036(-)
MINVQAVADYLASSSSGGAEDRALIASLLSIANTLAAQQAAAGTAPALAQPALLGAHALVPRAGFGSPDLAALETPPEMETLAEGIKMFVQRYPIDTRAYEYLVTSSATVVAHVLRDFRPPHEGEADYSRLLTTYVKRIRSHYMGVGDIAGGQAPVIGPATAAGSLLSRWRPAGLPAPSLAASLPGIVTTPQMPDKVAEVDLVEAVQAFVQKYPADDRAYNLLVNASPAVQLRVLREFRPHRLGDSDYSALLTTFTKKCIDQDAQGAAVAQQPGLALPPIQLPATVPGDLATAMVTPGLDAFLAKYPIDERAYNFFAVSSAEVQAKVLREFQPMHEGEASYSKLFTSFVNKCRTAIAGCGGQVDAQPAPLPALQEPPRHVEPPQRVDGAASALAALLDGGANEVPAGSDAARGALAVLPEKAGEALDLEEFRLRFPMDDRAFEFLATAPREVQERVLETFVPQRLDDTDFSAPVTAYVRSLRNQLADANVSAGVTEEAVSRFFERYPCDARAADYFQTCTPEVQVQVLRDFRPRSEGDSDYSAAVTAYIKRCKLQSREAANGGGSGWAPLQQQLGNWRPPLRPPAGGWGPPKRPRLG